MRLRGVSAAAAISPPHVREKGGREDVMFFSAGSLGFAKLTARSIVAGGMDCGFDFRFCEGLFCKTSTNAFQGRPIAGGRPGSQHCSTVASYSARSLSGREFVSL